MQVSAVGFRAGYRVLVAAVKAAGVIEPRRRAATDRVFLHVGEDAVVVGARERGQAVDVTLQVGISLNLETEIAELDVDGYTVPLSCLSLDEFPNPLEEAGTPVVVDRDTFCDMFSRVVACACSDELLAVLTNVQARIESGEVQLLATDRYRASHGRLPATGAGPVQEVLLPGAVVTKLLPFLTGLEIAIGVGEVDGDTVVTLTAGAVTVQLVSPELQFPRIEHLFLDSATATATATLDRARLHHAATRAAALTAAVGEKHSPVRILVDPDSVTVVPTTRDGVGAGPALPAEVAGIDETLTVGVNRDFFVNALAQIHGDHVTLHLSTPSKPVMLTGTDDEFRHVLMPMRLTT